MTSSFGFSTPNTTQSARPPGASGVNAVTGPAAGAVFHWKTVEMSSGSMLSTTFALNWAIHRRASYSACDTTHVLATKPTGGEAGASESSYRPAAVFHCGRFKPVLGLKYARPFRATHRRTKMSDASACRSADAFW